MFPTKAVFLKVLRDYCIQEGSAITVEKADSKSFTTCCAVDTCDGRIHASVIVDKISREIKTLKGEHKTCGILEEKSMVWLCKHLTDHIATNPDVLVESFQKFALV